MSEIHMIATNYGDFYGLSSPQIPELVGGRTTAAEVQVLAEELVRGLQEEGLLVGVSKVWMHQAAYVEGPEGDPYRVIASSEGWQDRITTLMTVCRMLEDGDTELRVDVPTNSAGERTVIIALEDDQLGWLVEQIDAGEAAVVTSIDRGIGQSFDLGRHGSLPDSDSLESLGLGLDSTFAEAMNVILGKMVHDLRRPGILVGV